MASGDYQGEYDKGNAAVLISNARFMDTIVYCGDHDRSIATIDSVPTVEYQYKDKGPCRESAKSILMQRINQLRLKAEGLDELYKLAPESGPAERTLYKILHGSCYYIE